MCSIGEDDFGDGGGAHAMPKDTVLDETVLSGICKKCNQNEVVVKMDFKEPECKDCFLENVRHKFRATLGSSKVLPREADVLVIFDGSAESVALLDMIHFAVNQNNFKRLRCNPRVLYVDEEFLKNAPTECSLLTAKEIISNYDIKAYVVSLASKSNPIEFKDFGGRSGFVEYEETFLKHLKNIKTLTSQQDFISKMRYNRIKLAAEQLGCKFVLLPDISLTLATTLLADVILGRGRSTALDVSFLDDRNQNLTIIRPIKDLGAKEVTTYVRLNGLRCPGRCLFGDTSGANASLQNLTKAFIDNLQNNFSSTVSTVFRTGDKLAPKTSSPSERDLNGGLEQSMNGLSIRSDRCAFCCSALDFSNSKTLFATEFSRLVSNTASQDLTDLESLEELTNMQVQGTENCTLKSLCHGCRNIYNEYPDFFGT